MGTPADAHATNPGPAARAPYVDPRLDSAARRSTEIREVLGELPGVSAVGLASHLPRMSPWPEPVELEDGARLARIPVVYQGPGLFDVLEVEPIAGRSIEPADLAPGVPPVAVVNASLAQRYFGTSQVVGRRLRIVGRDGPDDDAPWREIVGVVPDVMEVTGSGSSAGIYVPLSTSRFVSAALRVTGDPMSLASRLRRALYDLDPRIEVSSVDRLDAVGGENRLALRLMTAGMVGVGAVALLLSLAGVYAIVSLAVTQRTREIGVRVALGAAPGSVLRTVLTRSVVLVLAGGAVGAGLGLVGGGADVFVFAVPDPRWWQYVVLVAGMGLAAAAACWVPAWRALAIQPVEALRAEG